MSSKIKKLEDKKKKELEAKLKELEDKKKINKLSNQPLINLEK